MNSSGPIAPRFCRVYAKACPHCHSMYLAFDTWTAWLVHSSTHRTYLGTGERGQDRGGTCHALGIAVLQGDVAYGQCRFLRSVSTQANPPPYSVPVQTNGTPYGCGERTGPWRHMPCSGHRCPCRAMSLMASAASCVQLPRRLTHHHTVCRCRLMAHRMAVERGSYMIGSANR